MIIPIDLANIHLPGETTRHAEATRVKLQYNYWFCACRTRGCGRYHHHPKCSVCPYRNQWSCESVVDSVRVAGDCYTATLNMDTRAVCLICEIRLVSNVKKMIAAARLLHTVLSLLAGI